MRVALDRLYAASGGLAAACLAVIGLMVGAQLVGRIVDGIMRLAGLRPYGFIVEGLAEIAGYLLAASTLLALAPTLKAGAHIRVTLALSAVRIGGRRILEILAFGVAAAFCGYMTARIGLLALDSWRFHEVSHGLVPLPLAWPQAVMAVGLLVMTIALLDELVVVARAGHPSFSAAEDAVSLGKEG
jgi:TRAP-type C4-dicarboxylate transport system permease small subunit